MDIRIEGGPEYAMAICRLQAGEAVRAESGAMATMDPDIEVQTQARGGVLKGLSRKILQGESFFQNTFTARTRDAEISFVNAALGDLMVHELQDEEFYLSSGAYVLSGEGVETNAKWGGLRGMFGGTGLVMLRCSGSGPLVFGAFGALMSIPVSGEYVVDTGHVVGFEPSLDYELSSIGGIKSFLFSGESLVMRFRGEGRVWIQTRNGPAFGAWANQFRRVQSSSDSGGGGD